MLLSSLKVGLIGVLEPLIQLFLASHLGLDLQFVPSAVVFVYRLVRIRRAEKVLDWSPLLPDYVQLILYRVSVHDIR